MEKVAAVDRREKVTRLCQRIPYAEMVVRRESTDADPERDCWLCPYPFDRGGLGSQHSEGKIITQKNSVAAPRRQDRVQVCRIEIGKQMLGLIVDFAGSLRRK